MTVGGLPRPSMGAMLAGASGPSGRSFPIDAAVDPATIPRYSFEDLIAGRLPPGVLKGRSVIVGATAIELGDRYPTPRGGVLPGALMQAMAAETLLQRADAQALGPLPALVLAAIALIASRDLRARARNAALAALAASVLLLPLGLELLRAPSVEIAPALAAVSAASLLLAAMSAASTLRRARLTDAATGLPNSRALIEALGRNVRAGGVVTLRLRNHADLLAVLGDQGVARVVLKLAERVRFATGAEVHRIDENALAWPAPAGSDGNGVREQVNALAGVLRAPVEVDGRFLKTACAFGFADLQEGPEAAVSHSRLAAGRALDRSGRLELHRADWSEESEVRLSLAADFDQALAKGDIWVAYQPKLDIASGEITSVEALVRWHHPHRGALAPDLFSRSSRSGVGCRSSRFTWSPAFSAIWSSGAAWA